MGSLYYLAPGFWLLAAIGGLMGQEIGGDLRQWHKVTLPVEGPASSETGAENPFLDYRLTVTFAHSSGSPRYETPGYFAADGNAANTSAGSGRVWRAHFTPDKPGRWTYEIAFVRGPRAAVEAAPGQRPVEGVHGKRGGFHIAPTNKRLPDFRAAGRLRYTGEHFLRFAGNGRYFLKTGSDSPETLLAYEDFDGTTTRRTPLKRYAPHMPDWRAGDPAWRDGKGKGLIGALNYLSAKGVNAISFLTYNAGGDGGNVWPYLNPEDKLRFDCSKLDQWGIVFDHAQAKGLYLHFKLQEQENDDNRTGSSGEPGRVPAALDGGALGIERKLYLRELIARFGYALALNWNLGEENTQSASEQRDMAKYIHGTDPYRHHIVVHTFPPWQDRVYSALTGEQSVLTGASLQMAWDAVHRRTLHWRAESAKAGKRWVVANDEQGSSQHGVPPDPGYRGWNGQDAAGRAVPTLHDIRKSVLWGNLMAGGAGVEYYFGYQLPENDLLLEDFRSRDQTWNFCRFAREFFERERIPFWEMANADDLAGNPSHGNGRFVLAKPGRIYLVYLAEPGPVQLDLSGARGSFRVRWYNPRAGGRMQYGSLRRVAAGGVAQLGSPPESSGDWAVLVEQQ